MNIDPLEILKAKRAELGTKAVAEIIGYSESTIRVICAGKYKGDEAAVYAAVLRRFVDVVACPYIGEDIPTADCHTRAKGPRPFGGRAREAWWLACQDCELNPNRIKR